MEGGKRYVTHLLSERNTQIVTLLKSTKSYICEICKEDFSIRYGVEYIEAHHKIPVSAVPAKRAVVLEDFALLCSNCHSAVHAHMRAGLEVYMDIKEVIVKRLAHK
ncbi:MULTISPECIES: HNH endonuclease [unclassified Pseudomonas]|uniref:HNH endonuclease n=1 Tax=unclassified Pseudomonas TaxID=196821 RepID=UPI00215C1C41|nr:MULTISPECIES: HNH endonuclease [unclassified Pseudomonas]MCR8931100.1 HNH endonuclease [Pseudomonas sp. S11A4]MCR8974708.1 HNH endonuclease [Pseudomonas sp. S11P7]